MLIQIKFQIYSGFFLRFYLDKKFPDVMFLNLETFILLDLLEINLY